MSIYATLWRLKFPRYGDDHTSCDWIAVMAQGVPAHVGTWSPGRDSEAEDPYSAFLPPAGAAPTDDDGQTMRAVVFVTEATPKGTARSPQEYIGPLLVLSGQEYATTTFGQLHHMICDALRGHRPRLVAESWGPDSGRPAALRRRQRPGRREPRRMSASEPRRPIGVTPTEARRRHARTKS